jgi:hypothetical protein
MLREGCQMAAPNYSSNNPQEDRTITEALTPIVAEQYDVLRELRQMTLQLALNPQSTSYTALSKEVEAITKSQNERFRAIDHYINENILKIKKGKMTSNRMFLYGKELRKIEAGIRTVKLFLCDVVNALNANNMVTQQVKDRVNYAEKRIDALGEELYKIEQLIQRKTI